MKFTIPALSVLLFACASPNIQENEYEEGISSEDKDVAEESTEENLPNEDLEESQEEEEESTPVEPEENNGGFEGELLSGTWVVAGATLVEDPCDWDNQLRSFFGIGADALLPRDFTVDASNGSFLIEANSYGAAGPIECIINNSDFSCETQSVTPIDFELGQMGWTYAIEFSGSITDERSLVGTTITSFPTISEYLVPVFEGLGVDTTQCIQNYELTLTFGE